MAKRVVVRGEEVEVTVELDEGEVVRCGSGSRCRRRRG